MLTELPTGTVTFLFTDIEGSTQLLQELDERYAEVLAEHRRVLREAWRKHDGVGDHRETEDFGDLLAFVSSREQHAERLIAASVEMLRGFDSRRLHFPR